MISNPGLALVFTVSRSLVGPENFRPLSYSNFQLSVDSSVGIYYFCFSFQNSRHLLKKSADTKPVTTKSPAFSRALDNVVAFTMNSRGLLKLFSFFFRLAVVFTLVFVLRHSVEKHSIQKFFFFYF